MWAFMDGDKNNFVTSNKLGKERVHKENGKYAFLMESTSVEYITERECELTQIGGLLDSKGYGIALRPSKNKLSKVVCCFTSFVFRYGLPNRIGFLLT